MREWVDWIGWLVAFMCIMGLFWVMHHGPQEAAREIGLTIRAFREAAGL